MKNKLKIFLNVQLGLIALMFIIAMNYVELNVGGSGIQLPYNAITWSVATVFMLISMIAWVSVRQVRFPKVFSYYLLSVGLILLPLVYNDTLLIDTVYLVFVGLAAGIGYLFNLYQNQYQYFKRNLLKILLASTIIQTIWGLIQYYFIVEPSPLFYRSVLGQPYGVFQQVNDFSSYLAVGSLIAIYYLFRDKQVTPVKLIGCLGLLFLNHHLMVLSKVTTMLVVSVVSILFYLTFINYKEKRFSTSILIILVVLVAAFLPREVIYKRPAEVAQEQKYVELEKLHAKKTDTSSKKEVSEEKTVSVQEDVSLLDKKEFIDWSFLGTRQTIYPITIKMILDKPVTGHGIGTFGRKYLEYQAAYLQINPNAPAEFYLDHAHNEILQWAVQLGVVSSIGFLAILLVWIYFCRQKILDPRLLLLAMPMVLHSMFELPFYHSAPHFLMFISLLYIADNSKSRRVKLPRIPSIGVILVTLYLAFHAQMFLFSTVYANLMFHKYYGSGKKDLSALLSINNPAAFRKRYNFEFMQFKIAEANVKKTIKMEDLKSYIYWAYSVIQHAPQEPAYENFVSVLRINGNLDASLKYAKEAHYLYPRNPVFPKQVTELETLIGKK